MFFFAYFGKSGLVKYFGALEPNEREVYATVLKAFFSKSWHPKWPMTNKLVIFFSSNYSQLFFQQTTESLNKSAVCKCVLKFSKVSNGGPSWVGSFLIDSWLQGTRDGGWKTPGRWSLKFSWESNPCKVYVWDRNRSFIQAAGPPKQ